LRSEHADLLRSVLAPEYEFLQLLTPSSDDQGGEDPHGTQVPRRS
jgi:hypothetical protein